MNARRRAASCPAIILQSLTDEPSSNVEAAAAPTTFHWPPSVEWTTHYGVAAAGLLAIPAVLATVLSSKPGTGKGDLQQQWNDAELARRENTLSELIKVATTSLADGSGKVSSSDMLEAVQKVVAMSRSHSLLAQGLILTCDLLFVELPEATDKTDKGEADEYLDGGKLAQYVLECEELRACAKRCRMSKSDYSKVWQKLAEVRLLARVAERTRWAVRAKDPAKAFNLICIARSQLPWIAVSSLLSTASGILRTAEVYYRAESLEVFRYPAWTWATFRRTTYALALTKMILTLVEIVTARINDISQTSLESIYKTEVYQSLLKKDLEWYRIGQKDAKNANSIMLQTVALLPGQVMEVLSIPQVVIQDVTNLITQVALVRRRSSALLYALIGIQWTAAAMQAAVSYVKDMVMEDLRSGTARPKWEDSHFDEPLLPDTLPTTKSFSYEKKASQNWRNYQESEVLYYRKVGALRDAFKPLAASLDDAGSFAERGWCGRLIKDGRLEVGDMLNVQTYAQDVSSIARNLPKTVFGIRDKLIPLAKAWDLLQVGYTIKSGSFIPYGEDGLPKRGKGYLKLEHVEFAYPDANKTLLGINLEVPAGMTVGLTGTSGGGKSTIFTLLQRLYDPSSGVIMFDDKRIEEYDLHWIRRQVALVPQLDRIRFFSATLWENLVIGCEEDPSESKVIEICKTVGIWKMICARFPAGLQTRVTAQTNFSGGERQRIAIARALLMEAPVLLMDEATSALDADNQRKVQASLSQLEPRRTLIVIAHRLETIRDSDKIVCLHAGMVAEEGTHEELVDKVLQVSVTYATQGHFEADITMSASGNKVVSVVNKGPADLNVVRVGFEVLRAEHVPLGYKVDFVGPGVYAELCRRPADATPSAVTDVAPSAEEEEEEIMLMSEDKSRVMTKLGHVEAALATLDNDEAVLDFPSPDSLWNTLMDMRRKMASLISELQKKVETPKARL